ncbi:hypothetical protein B0I32_105358 [Nonomuraea fuscirosea]|uniref:Uncharacterized protein n=1 Tax=Nonomuraea fuscirosea TaxID=1291556 RepID=A0A2T0N460_9ACTN|nr:hypothetical protein B0I32_105358 [Nonomuraea fuscirosea]
MESLWWILLAVMVLVTAVWWRMSRSAHLRRQRKS